MEQQAKIEVGHDRVVRCTGNWTLYHIAALESELATLSRPGLEEMVWDLSGVAAMDTSGAWLLYRTINHLEAKGQRVRLHGLSADFAGLLETLGRTWPGSDATKAPGEGGARRTVRGRVAGGGGA